MSAILFGSISTLADTSELQRRAFNEAFAARGLGWEWSRDDYTAMLGSSGGANRIAEFAASRGERVDAADVHEAKSQIFQDLLARSSVAPRPGVVEVIEGARANGVKVAFVTTTAAANISALLAALGPDISADSFDLIVDSDSVGAPKPDAASYLYALDRLGVDAASAVAIEDNMGGLAAAASAGIRCVAFPNENTASGDFGGATETVESLEPGQVLQMADA